MFITANPSAANVTTTVSLLYGSSTLNTKTNVGANGSYGGVTAIGIISVTDTTKALRFVASNAASNDNYNLYGCCYLGAITNQMS